MAAAITKATGESVELISGDRGEFTVWVDDQKVADKIDGDFPGDGDCVDAAAAALA